MYKYTGFKSFKITECLTVEAQAQGTRYGFRHIATLYLDGVNIGNTKSCYYNRTWEAWIYQTVIENMIRKAFEAGKINKDVFNEAIKWAEGDHTDWTGFRATAMVAALGSIMTPNQAGANDWKARMLKAGLPALDIPADWESLTEDEKTKRLDGVIGILKH